MIWVRTKAEYFCAKGWTAQITLINRENSGSARGLDVGARLTVIPGRAKHEPQNNRASSETNRSRRKTRRLGAAFYRPAR